MTVKKWCVRVCVCGQYTYTIQYKQQKTEKQNKKSFHTKKAEKYSDKTK